MTKRYKRQLLALCGKELFGIQSCPHIGLPLKVVHSLSWQCPRETEKRLLGNVGLIEKIHELNQMVSNGTFQESGVVFFYYF